MLKIWKSLDGVDAERKKEKQESENSPLTSPTSSSFSATLPVSLFQKRKEKRKKLKRALHFYLQPKLYAPSRGPQPDGTGWIYIYFFQTCSVREVYGFSSLLHSLTSLFSFFSFLFLMGRQKTTIVYFSLLHILAVFFPLPFSFLWNWRTKNIIPPEQSEGIYTSSKLTYYRGENLPPPIFFCCGLM